MVVDPPVPHPRSTTGGLDPRVRMVLDVLAGRSVESVAAAWNVETSLVQPIGDRPMPLEESMQRTEELLLAAAARLARAVGIGLNLAAR